MKKTMVIWHLLVFPVFQSADLYLSKASIIALSGIYLKLAFEPENVLNAKKSSVRKR